jgi:spermidine synthase
VEITSVWFAGATNLYSKEFYQLAKSRLQPGGALQQWVQLHHIGPREVQGAIATIRSVFPYVSLWWAGGQGIVVATDRPQILTPGRKAYLEERLNEFRGVPVSAQDRLRDHIFSSRVLDPNGTDRLVASGPTTINTDHNRWIEYATPRYNWTDRDWETSNLRWLKSFAGSDTGRLPSTGEQSLRPAPLARERDSAWAEGVAAGRSEPRAVP